MALKNRHVFELRLGKLGLMLFIGGMSLLLFALFLMGVVVGKHMEAYPERYAAALPEIIRDRLLGDEPPAGAVVVPPAVERDRSEEAPGGAETAPVVTAPDPVAAQKGEAAETNVQKAPAPAEVKPVADPAVKSSAAAEKAPQRKGRYEVQAGAYRERQPAEQLVKKMAALGFASEVVMKELPGKGQWFRVIVGGFESRVKAQEAADQLAGKVNGLKCVIRASGDNGNGG